MSKTLRQFQCRDDLWARVEALAKRRGIATDDVVQAALLQLFKGAAKGKKDETSGMTDAPPAGPSTPARAVLSTQPGHPGAARPASAPLPSAAPVPRPPGVRPPGSGPMTSPPPGPAAPPAGISSSQSRAPSTLPQPRLPKPTGAPAPAPMPPSPAAAPAGPPTLGPPASAPVKTAPTLPRPPTGSRLPPPTGAPVSKPRPLYVLFEGQWYEIDKEEFVIGRGQKFSDLAIKDANISRRHASVVRRGNDYFIKDLGSTNGIEFEGQRVDNHKVIDGSVYFLCDHELRFTFTPPSQAS
ncbi:FHA domain-containing protein [Nannocystis radixulma]|uniref:FHA domain-containing protein n=1 Tax=Nannocystis radixulma TaxID=2995305 RepID=A0ABT5B2X4_9BACT|nr:FHA domain-containing protein [Nannocystis radixulma]MDC0667492.1 FHA domain-containing protein [Nannocystis radixulma]